MADNGDEALLNRWPMYHLPCLSPLQNTMGTFGPTDGPGYKKFKGPDVTARRHGRTGYLQVEGGDITTKTLLELKWYLTEWYDPYASPSDKQLVEGLTFIDCNFKGEAASYFAEHFAYMRWLKHLEIINCDCAEVCVASVSDTNNHRDSVTSFYMYGRMKGQWPERALSSIVNRFVENNPKLREVFLWNTGETAVPATTRVLKSLLDRCERERQDGGVYYLVGLHLDLMENRQAELLRDILGHTNSFIRHLYLGEDSQLHSGLATILSGLGTNNGSLKSLELNEVPWELADWKMLSTSLKANQNHEFQLKRLFTGNLIGAGAAITEDLIAEVNSSFDRQYSINMIDTPGMEQLGFLELKARIAKSMRWESGDTHDDDGDLKWGWRPITDKFFEYDVYIERALTDHLDSWREMHHNRSDEVLNAECLSATYYAIRSGAGMNKLIEVANRHRVPLPEPICRTPMIQEAHEPAVPVPQPIAIKVPREPVIPPEGNESNGHPQKKRKLFHSMTTMVKSTMNMALGVVYGETLGE